MKITIPAAVATRTVLKAIFLAHVVVASIAAAAQPALTETVSIFIVRHPEVDQSQPETLPLSAAGRQRAEVLASTLRGVTFTHVFASHTTRSRQAVEAIAAKHGLKVIQLPAPGSVFDGEKVTDQTSRRAPIEPISKALLALPPGSVALAGLNSENIYAVLNRLGVSTAKPGEACTPGVWCVPCTDNSCYPRGEFDHLWHIVLQPGRSTPLAFSELRYGGK